MVDLFDLVHFCNIDSLLMDKGFVFVSVCDSHTHHMMLIAILQEVCPHRKCSAPESIRLFASFP